CYLALRYLHSFPTRRSSDLWRNLWKHKLYTSINIVGLSVGIGACLLIFLFVHYELTYDQQNLHFKRITRITTTLYTPESDLAFRSEEHTSELQSRENLVCRL